MSLKLIGKKAGMTQIFDDKGELIVCTVISMEQNRIAQIKREERDGYKAIQMASMNKKKVTKPLMGHFGKAKIDICSALLESRVEDVEGYEVGQSFGVDFFQEGDFVDVTGTSKGKGFQGVIKLHGFSGGPAAHGSGFHRHAGSTGMRSTPGRCFPGGPRASRMGGERVTQQGLKVVKVDAMKNLLLLEGSIPGSRGGKVYLQRAKKKKNK